MNIVLLIFPTIILLVMIAVSRLVLMINIFLIAAFPMFVLILAKKGIWKFLSRKTILYFSLFISALCISSRRIILASKSLEDHLFVVANLNPIVVVLAVAVIGSVSFFLIWRRKTHRCLKKVQDINEEKIELELGVNLVRLVCCKKKKSSLLKSIENLHAKKGFSELPGIHIVDNLTFDKNQFKLTWRNIEKNYTFTENESNEEKVKEIISDIETIYMTGEILKIIT